MTHRPGDRITATLTDTTGATNTAELTVLTTDRLGCGCDRLTAGRPGPTPKARGVHLLTGCGHGHQSQLTPTAPAAGDHPPTTHTPSRQEG
jgi:hypothetical protein